MDIDQFKNNVLIYSDRVYRFALKIVADQQIAEDVVQEILMKLWIIRNKLDSYKSLEALVFKMTKNLCLDKLKKNKKIIRVNYQLEKQDAINIHAHFEYKNELEMVKKLIQVLPQKQKMILHLRNIERLAIKDIATILEMKENTISQQLSRIRKTLRVELDKINSYGVNK